MYKMRDARTKTQQKKQRPFEGHMKAKCKESAATMRTFSAADQPSCARAQRAEPCFAVPGSP